MEEDQVDNVQQQVDPQESNPPPKKKRQVSAEAKAKMLENLQKAREAKAANRKNVTKYPKNKRERAVEMYNLDITAKAEALAAEKAEKLAEELIRKKEQEAELEQFRIWKTQQQTQQQTEEKRSTKKKATPPKKKEQENPPEAPAKKKRTPRKKQQETGSEQDVNDIDTGHYQGYGYPFDFSATFDMSDFID
ncbi:hypothetical protein HDV00_001008 [Rhizophlyctis rosea]|nr:hypothetical protein HDV00_001008 [Rhizophlyctis rosea]